MKFMIYGAGTRGKRIIKMWGDARDCEIAGFFDKEKIGSVMGIPICSLADAQQDVPVVISLAKGQLAAEISRNLREAGFKKIYWYCENPYRDTFQGQLVDTEGRDASTLPYVEMHLSDMCNLNCRGCTHFSPLFHRVDADFASRMDDVKRLAGKVSHIMVFRLLGGEPFLNPEVGAYAEGIRKLLPWTRLDIVTNGLLVPKLSNEVLESLHYAEVVVDITEYPPTHEIVDEITKKLDDSGVKYTIGRLEGKSCFNKPLELVPSGKYPQKCISTGCVNLYKGKISRCPTLMYAFKLNETFGAQLPTEGIMNLDDAPSGTVLLKKLGETVPLCAHCVENPMPWGRCEGKPRICDFAAV